MFVRNAVENCIGKLARNVCTSARAGNARWPALRLKLKPYPTYTDHGAGKPRGDCRGLKRAFCSLLRQMSVVKAARQVAVPRRFALSHAPPPRDAAPEPPRSPMIPRAADST
eukprot:7275381-Prymnesium_polylepis.2